MRHALITGGSMGIGLAVAEVLAEAGWRLTLVARGQAQLDAALAAFPGEGHRAWALDVSDEAAWGVQMESLGELHGLVCAAGVLGPVGPPGSYTPSEFRRTIDINLLGAFLAVHHTLAALRASRGAIVMFSGGGATKPLPRYDAYAASKAAVVRLSENLAASLVDDGVRINCVAPGFVATRIHEGTLAAGPERAGEACFARTKHDIRTGGVPAREAAELTRLLLEQDDPPVTGRLISAQWDPWRDAEFRARLANSPDLATLRRIDDVAYTVST